MVYFSNGTEGMILDDQCSNCPVGEDCCPVYSIQMMYNYAQLNKGNEDLKVAMDLLINEKGKCQIREALKRANGTPDPDPTPIDPKTLPAFLKMD